MRERTGATVIGGLLLAAACTVSVILLFRSGLFAITEQKLWAAGLFAVVLVFGFMLSSGILGAGRASGFVWLAAGCAAVMCLRFLFLNFTSGDYNNFLSKWMQYFRDNGGFKGISGSVGDYNVTYLYFLALFSYSPLPDLYLIKLLSIAFDFVTAYYAMKLVASQKGAVKARSAAFFITLMLPTVVLNGAYWAQCDSIYAAFALGALYYAIVERHPMSLAMLGVALAFKLQTVFIMPLWALLLITGRLKFRWLPVFPAAYFITALPAMLLGKPLGDILSVYINQTGTYSDYLNLNSPSIFAFFDTVDNKTGALCGIAAACIFCIILFALARGGKRKPDKRLLCLYALAFCIGVPFLLPHMHDRYFFMADVLAMALVWIDWKLLPVALLTQIASLTCYGAYFRVSDTDLRVPAAFMGTALVLTLLPIVSSGLRQKGRREG